MAVRAVMQATSDTLHHIFSLEPLGGVLKPLCSSHWLSSLLKLLSPALILEGPGIGMLLDPASVVEGA
jgi:hypothetical protein